MKQGEIFKRFGCTWVVDRVYTTNNPDLFYNKRYTAHVIEKPNGYKGITEINAAL